VQNKANFETGECVLTGVRKRGYQKIVRDLPLEKQSQFFLRVHSVPVRASGETPDGVTTSGGPIVQNKANFAMGECMLTGVQE